MRGIQQTDLRQVTESTEINGMTFPARMDYEHYFIGKGIVNNPSELWNNDDLVSKVQRHWHTKGQNGCVFAQAVSSRGEELGWESKVMNIPADSVNSPLSIELMNQILENKIASPENQVLSLLFPQVVNEESLRQVVAAISRMERMTAFYSEYEDKEVIMLRASLNSHGTLSWLVAFGPFDFFPQTRQAPVTEFAIRTKIKPDRLFSRLNSDKEAAHLADVPTDFSETVMERLWQTTSKRTRAILQDTPRQISSAKVSLVLPKRE